MIDPVSWGAPSDGVTLKLNGIDLFVRVMGEGRPLVLLHGGGGAGVNWQQVFDQHPEGYRLIVPDLRGHGRSTNPSGEFTFHQSALDVLAMLDHLGIEHCQAIGLSLGAKTMLHASTMQPSRVGAVVLVSATPYFPEQARALMRQVTEETRTAEEWRLMRGWHAHGDEQIRALWRMTRRFADSYSDLNFTPSLLSTMTARTLIVHGDRDPLYPIELAVEMYRAIPRASLLVVPDGGHGPIFGLQVTPFRELALSFLRDGSAGGAKPGA